MGNFAPIVHVICYRFKHYNFSIQPKSLILLILYLIESLIIRHTSLFDIFNICTYLK